jgi:hypothetical protein
MTFPNIDCARHVRHGGIDAMAALNEALREALVGLNAEDQHELKQTFGHVMAEIVDTLINPAVRAYPSLDPSDDTWLSVVRARAAARANAA